MRLTYGRPFKVWLRLTKEQPIEEEVYLGDIPIMLGGGEFIINGAERVVVSQLHRSPGVDFVSEMEGRRAAAAKLPHHSRTRQLDRTERQPQGKPLRPHRPERQVLDHDAAAGDGSASTATTPICCASSIETETVKIVNSRSAAKIEGKLAVGDVVYPADSPRAGEIIVECGQKITKNAAETICTSGLKQVEVMADPKNPLLLNALADDNTASHEEALLRIYQRLRPGNPPQLEKARALFHEKFYDTNRYRLGRVGRFRINRKLGLNIPEDGDDPPAPTTSSPRSSIWCSCATTSRTRKSTTSTTWATAGCGPSTSWPRTSCARASSSCGARSRSG